MLLSEHSLILQYKRLRKQRNCTNSYYSETVRPVAAEEGTVWVPGPGWGDEDREGSGEPGPVREVHQRGRLRNVLSECLQCFHCYHSYIPNYSLPHPFPEKSQSKWINFTPTWKNWTSDFLAFRLELIIHNKTFCLNRFSDGKTGGPDSDCERGASLRVQHINYFKYFDHGRPHWIIISLPFVSGWQVHD